MGGLSGGKRVCTLSSAQCPAQIMRSLESGGDDPCKSGLRKERERFCAYAVAGGKNRLRLETHFLSSGQPRNTLEEVGQNLCSPKGPLSLQRGDWVNW